VSYRIALAGEAHTVSHLQEKRIPYRTCRRSAYRIDLQEKRIPYRLAGEAHTVSTCRSAYRIALAGEAHTVSHLQEKRIPYRLAGEAHTAAGTLMKSCPVVTATVCLVNGRKET